jgi:APA family basic amino acid/polyamine antiporter
MSRDGLLPSPLAVVHRRFKTPWINTIIVGVAASCAAGLMSLDALSDLANVGSLTAFALVCLTVLYLRWKDPDLHRPFRTPLHPLVPILGAVMCVVLMLSLVMGKAATRDFFLIYLAGGILVYFAFGMWNSKLAKGEVVLGHEPAPYELPE